MLLCCQAEPPRGREVERFGITRQLADHAGKIAALQTFFQCEQDVLCCLRCDMDDPFAQIGWQARTVGTTVEPDRFAILHPQHAAQVFSLFMLPAPSAAQLIERQRDCCSRPARFARWSQHFRVQCLSQTGPPVTRARFPQPDQSGPDIRWQGSSR